MNYPISFYLKTSSFLLQSLLLFCGYYNNLTYCFTISYILSVVFGISSFVLSSFISTSKKSNEFHIQRETHHSVLSLSFVAGVALLLFTGMGRLFFDNTYHVESITVFFSIVLITQAFEKPKDTLLRWEKDGLLIIGEKFSNVLSHGSITQFEMDSDSLTIYTTDGITHHIEHIIWDENERQEAQVFLNKFDTTE
ncbi:MAG: hypothetical protein RL607_1182 [Bacteroidota bacterium]